MGYAIPTFPTTFTGTGGSGGSSGGCTVINNISCGGDGSGGAVVPNEFAWARVLPTGVAAALKNVLSTSRVSVGNYRAIVDATPLTVGGFAQLAAVATPSSQAGSGGDGISPFRTFSSHHVVLTDPGAGDWFPTAGNKIALLGQTDDDLYIHDLANFVDAATVQVDAGGNTRSPGNSGCMNREGTQIWWSGDTGGGGYGVRMYDFGTNVLTNFGVSDKIIVAATETYVIVYETSTWKRYNFNVGTSSLGLPIHSWAILTTNTGTWDPYGFIWAVGSGILVRINPNVDSTWRYYTFPTTPPLLTWYSSPIFDVYRNCLYVPLTNSGVSTGWIFRVSGWSDYENDIAQWDMVLSLGPHIPIGIWHDTSTDIMFIVDYNAKYVLRVYVPNWSIIDVTRVINNALDIPPDYTVSAVRWAYYANDKGYLVVDGPSTHYILEMEFDGDPIAGYGGGSGSVSGILVAHTTVLDATTVQIEIFRSLNPPIYVDAQFSVHIGYDTGADTGEPGGGGGGTGEAEHQHVKSFAFGDSTPALIGEIPAGKRILSAQVFVNQAFNGTGAALSIGTAALSEDLLAQLDNNPAAVGEYSVYTEKLYATLTQLYLHITPGSGASAGTGVAVIEYQP